MSEAGTRVVSCSQTSHHMHKQNEASVITEAHWRQDWDEKNTGSSEHIESTRAKSAEKASINHGRPMVSSQNCGARPSGGIQHRHSFWTWLETRWTWTFHNQQDQWALEHASPCCLWPPSQCAHLYETTQSGVYSFSCTVNAVS